MIDPIRNLPLDRNHPISLLYDPAVRLCGEYFKSTTAIQCPFGVKNINFQDQKYECANESEKRIALLEQQFAAQQQQLNTLTSLLAGGGPLKIVTGGSESECGNTNKMRCPDGYFAIGYSAWVTSSNITSCAVSCRKIVP